MEPFEAQFERMTEMAKEAFRSGDVERAKRIVADKVARTSAIYRETGYWGLSGAHDDREIANQERHLRDLEYSVVGIPRPPKSKREVMLQRVGKAYGDAIATRDVDAAAEQYGYMCRLSMAGQPEWQERPEDEWERAIERQVHSALLTLPWASAEDLARLGVRVAERVEQPGGGHAIACGYCGAALDAPDGVQQLECGHCQGTTRVQLSREQVLRASMPEATDEEIAMQLEIEAISRGDLDALRSFAQRQVSGSGVEPGSVQEREMIYSYAALMRPPGAAELPALLAELGLQRELVCESCGQRVGVAASSRRCPMCGERV